MILVIEDEKHIARAVKDKLTRSGYNVVSVYSGIEALDYMQGNLPDLIILDVQMPEMDGFEVLRQVKADQRLNNIPIMLLTVLSQSEHAAERAIVDAWLTKPYKGNELLETVEKLIKSKNETKELL